MSGPGLSLLSAGIRLRLVAPALIICQATFLVAFGRRKSNWRSGRFKPITIWLRTGSALLICAFPSKAVLNLENAVQPRMDTDGHG